MVLDLLELLLKGDSNGEVFYQQVPYLTISKVEYTGSGVFIHFTLLPDVEVYRASAPDRNFDAVMICSEDLTAEAEAIVHIKDGLLDYFEIWSFDGNYPKGGISSYKAWQAWENSPGKCLVYPYNFSTLYLRDGSSASRSLIKDNLRREP